MRILKEKIIRYEDHHGRVKAMDQGELIRCKDCKFATIADGVYSRNQEVKYCDIWFPSEAEYMPIDYYCASAERKRQMTLDEATENYI